MTAATLTMKDLSQLVGVSVTPNLVSVLTGLRMAGDRAGLVFYHRLVPYLAQLSHESGSFVHDREIWGPTPAQRRYDSRTDLGNTVALDGDGEKYRGRTMIQITGKANTAMFRDWCRVNFVEVPDFVEDPDAMNTDPWEGLGPIWFWETRHLNHYADKGEFEMVTRLINGGLNGYDDRCRRFTEISLRALGYGAHEIKKFQSNNGLKADGIAGPKTRAALHTGLRGLPEITFESPEPKVEAFLTSSLDNQESQGFLDWIWAISAHLRRFLKGDTHV